MPPIISSHFPPFHTLSPRFMLFWGLFVLLLQENHPAYISRSKPFILNRYTFVYSFL